MLVALMNTFVPPWGTPLADFCVKWSSAERKRIIVVCCQTMSSSFFSSVLGNKCQGRPLYWIQRQAITAVPYHLGLCPPTEYTPPSSPFSTGSSKDAGPKQSIPCDKCVRQPIGGVSGGSGQALPKVFWKHQQIGTRNATLCSERPAVSRSQRRIEVFITMQVSAGGLARHYLSACISILGHNQAERT
jgi:hypothetical protein